MNKILLIGGGLFIVIIGLGLLVNSNKPEIETFTDVEALALVDTDYVAGDRESEVIFMEFSDLQCPACKGYYPLIEELKTQYSDRVAFVIRDFPLPFHVQARDAAYALRAAKAQGAFDEMRALIFEGQETWGGNTRAATFFERYAEELELDMVQFNADVESEAFRTEVANDVAKGRALNVNSTPTFLLNGEKITAQTVEQFALLLDDALAAAESTTITTENEEVETEL